MDRTSFQIELEEELRMLRRNISVVKNPAKKSKLIGAYEGLVELLKA